jgi:hypothetical protein
MSKSQDKQFTIKVLLTITAKAANYVSARRATRSMMARIRTVESYGGHGNMHAYVGVKGARIVPDKLLDNAAFDADELGDLLVAVGCLIATDPTIKDIHDPSEPLVALKHKLSAQLALIQAKDKAA